MSGVGVYSLRQRWVYIGILDSDALGFLAGLVWVAGAYPYSLLTVNALRM